MNIVGYDNEDKHYEAEKLRQKGDFCIKYCNSHNINTPFLDD